jgi:hypothetical protein
MASPLRPHTRVGTPPRTRKVGIAVSGRVTRYSETAPNGWLRRLRRRHRVSPARRRCGACARCRAFFSPLRVPAALATSRTPTLARTRAARRSRRAHKTPVHVQSGFVGVGAGEMADHPIGVHVRGSAAAGLEDVDWELVVVPAFHDLFCRGFDRFRQSCRQVTHG